MSAYSDTDDLLRLWEEEKLARDVYTHFRSATGLAVFGTIARSEHQHMQWIQRLLRGSGRAGIQFNDIPGRFSHPHIQQLFDSLVAEGARSLPAALVVADRIEERDIADLQSMLRYVKEPRTRQTLLRLIKGSQHHLHAFASQLALVR